MIKHIVMWKFKEGTEKEMNEFLSGLKGLYGQIDALKALEIGVSVNPDDNNYDAVMISEFESLDGLKAYKTDPRHVKVSSLCKSIRTDRGSVDFEF